MILGLLKQPRRLFDRVAIVGVVLFEQRRALDHAVAALDVNGGDQTLLGRPDFDEVGVGVALPFLRRGGPGAKEDPPQRAERQSEGRKDDNSTIHRGRRSHCLGFGRLAMPMLACAQPAA